MAEPLQRHDLVRADPAAWAAWLAAHPELAGLRQLRGWADAGRPLIVRRRMPGEGDEAVPLGLPLPPADGKRRIALAFPTTALTPLARISLSDVAGEAPPAWRSTIRALDAIGSAHEITPRPFGSLLWQAVTGLTYLSTTSDLDLLWPCHRGVPPGLLERIGVVAAAAPMRVDGEILFPDGFGLHWRELLEAPAGGSVLAKSMDRLTIRPADPLRAATPA
ncbi:MULTISPECIES: malonate decarboxylase holo-[acyl-carrier-protein] synthase [Methylobacterium]|uniref:Malonate decarboxylase holo-[acyl-carrier-protein] synthase n=1 Tax=Methylobacterium longum TaxID=767694 RepID=A0ABT8AH78_9HYPH|nr:MULTISPECIES: malonate decarboxylase holo-[acyl-carrier-protein] synthase [Methylobacterium]MCJ2100944.1 malonate decarboxylase holo-[acyl-carrier-protein] synthase [Methylobacterium sp. E-046]MDN3569166.1 malonate decarboxylase holo-[acyl-carrier-protein] synthase [Methylobacterium longum]GJE10575.1 Phosphoribosyl-dephospho-CoA transferase [Methylobacterium longum]